MASGYFPVLPSDKRWGAMLVAANTAINDVIEGWHESRGGLNVEDAASDQTYIDLLYGARVNIEECLGLDESDPEAVRAAHDEAEKRREYAERDVERLSKILSKLNAGKVADQVQAGIKTFVEG